MSPLLRSMTLLLFFLASCKDEKSSFDKEKAEMIARNHTESRFIPPPPLEKALPSYPWETDDPNQASPRITKEHFRCRGTSFNSPKEVGTGSEKRTYFDCGGKKRHGLPLFEGKEGVYPILIDLLNYIQKRTGKKVIITSGHRCPDHQNYIDPSPKAIASKKLIGAETTFYVQGYETKPESILKAIFEFYERDSSLTDKQKKWERYTKGDIDTQQQPWMNWELFIKIYKPHEGRDIDNRHPYPYISIQVRHDRKTGERVLYSWDKAYNNFHRH